MMIERNISHLIRIAAAVTRADEAVVETVLHEAVADGVETSELREILLQVVLFAGFPRVINAFEKLSRLVPKPAEGVAASPPDDDWAARGRALFGQIYGDNTERVLETIGGYHPDLADWILRDAYGKVLSRPALPPRTRELAAVAMLSVQDLPRQLFSHARGAVHVGASADEVRAVLDLLADLCEPEALARARAETEKAIG